MLKYLLIFDPLLLLERNDILEGDKEENCKFCNEGMFSTFVEVKLHSLLSLINIINECNINIENKFRYISFKIDHYLIFLVNRSDYCYLKEIYPRIVEKYLQLLFNIAVAKNIGWRNVL